jgi:hypothetical protein
MPVTIAIFTSTSFNNLRKAPVAKTRVERLIRAKFFNSGPLLMLLFARTTPVRSIGSKRNASIQKYHSTLGPDGMPAYYPWNATTYGNASLDNMVKQWHSIEFAFKLMDLSARQLGVTYSRVAMLRSDVMYLTPIDNAMPTFSFPSLYCFVEFPQLLCPDLHFLAR